MDKSPQYEAVLTNLDKLARTIRSTPGALRDLQRKFIVKSWLDPIAKTDADELTTLALNKIENNVKDYDLFMEMLSSVTGMDQIVGIIRGTLLELSKGLEVDEVDGATKCSHEQEVCIGGETVPSVAQLRVIKTSDGSKIEIIKMVAPKWRDIGDLLDFDKKGETLQQIEADKKHEGVESCCRAMFQYWLQGNGKPASWSTLLEILDDCHFPDLVAKLRSCD